MKISEMNSCIEKMRECYKFDDDKTEIMLADLRSSKSNCVTICTKDENGTEIAMTKCLNELTIALAITLGGMFKSSTINVVI